MAKRQRVGDSDDEFEELVYTDPDAWAGIPVPPPLPPSPPPELTPLQQVVAALDTSDRALFEDTVRLLFRTHGGGPTLQRALKRARVKLRQGFVPALAAVLRDNYRLQRSLQPYVQGALGPDALAAVKTYMRTHFRGTTEARFIALVQRTILRQDHALEDLKALLEADYVQGVLFVLRAQAGAYPRTRFEGETRDYVRSFLKSVLPLVLEALVRGQDPDAAEDLHALLADGKAAGLGSLAWAPLHAIVEGWGAGPDLHPGPEAETAARVLRLYVACGAAKDESKHTLGLLVPWRPVLSPLVMAACLDPSNGKGGPRVLTLFLDKAVVDAAHVCIRRLNGEPGGDDAEKILADVEAGLGGFGYEYVDTVMQPIAPLRHVIALLPTLHPNSFADADMDAIVDDDDDHPVTPTSTLRAITLDAVRLSALYPTVTTYVRFVISSYVVDQLVQTCGVPMAVSPSTLADILTAVPGSLASMIEAYYCGRGVDTTKGVTVSYLRQVTEELFARTHDLDVCVGFARGARLSEAEVAKFRDRVARWGPGRRAWVQAVVTAPVKV